MTVAVTGGAGRLGNVLTRRLLANGERVRVLDAEPDPASLRGLDVEHRVGSVLDADAVAGLLEGAEVCFHVAARIDLSRDRDGATARINVEGTRVVAEACRTRGIRMVHTSSHAALDRLPWEVPLDETRPLALADPCDYHRSKAHAEALVLELVERGLDATIVSPGTLTGPHDFGPSILGGALLDLYHRRLPVLIDAVTDYTDARDVADAMIVAAQRGGRGERYLLTGEVLDMRAMLAVLKRATGVPMPRVVLPLWVGWAALPVTAAIGRLRGETPLFHEGTLRAAVSNEVVSHEKAARELGYRVRSMTESMSDAFAFYSDQGWL